MLTQHDHSQSGLFNFVFRCLLVLLLTGCGTPPATATVPSAVAPSLTPTSKPLPNVKITVSQASERGDVANVKEGEGVAIVVVIEPYESLQWTWEVTGTSGGVLNINQGENVVYTAGKGGVDIVAVQAKTSEGETLKQTVTINVIAAPPKVTETPAPSNVLSVTPLEGVFPAVHGGVEFTFPEGQPDLIKRQFVEKGPCLYSAPNSVQLTYNFPKNKGGGWGVHWASSPAGYYDLKAEGFSTLTFWARGESGQETFQIGLKDINKKEVMVQSERYVIISASEWRPVVIPLSDFFDSKGPVDLTLIENMSIGFSHVHGSGTICIDDIAFQAK